MTNPACDRATRIRSEADAQLAANILRAKLKLSVDDWRWQVIVHFCEACKAWHCTKRRIPVSELMT